VIERRSGRYKGSRRIDAALHKKIHIEAKKGLGV
jgi:hypothetical protein